MTPVEIACVTFSVIETAVTIYLWRRYKKKLDAAIKKHTIATAEYESACKQLKIWSNAT